MLNGLGMLGSISPMNAPDELLAARVSERTVTFALKAARLPVLSTLPEIVALPPGATVEGVICTL